jgi:predicted nucleic acid-binding protein
MPIVIDATVTVAWFFQDESSTASEAVLDRLRDNEAIVPPLWQLEVTNALLVAEARGRLSEAQAARLLALLAQLPINIDQSPTDTVAVHACARRHNLSAYQASYLVLAERLALSLATADGALAEASRVAGIQLLGA